MSRYDRLYNHYAIELNSRKSNSENEINESIYEEGSLINELGGVIIEKGLVRFLEKNEIKGVNERICSYFPEIDSEEFSPFLVDWFGRYFGFGKLQRTGFILMFDPAVGEFYELEQSIEGFINNDLIDQKEDLFSYDRFLEWRKKEKYILKPNECVGFEILLFLGGKDDASNFSVYDIDVYWELNRQLKEQFKK